MEVAFLDLFDQFWWQGCENSTLNGWQVGRLPVLLEWLVDVHWVYSAMSEQDL